MSNLNRRSFLRTTATVGTGLVLFGAAGCGAGTGGDDGGLRMSVFGSETRQAKLRAVFDLYTAKNPDVAVELEAIANDSYLQKITTQVTGGDAPDVMAIYHSAVADFARRGVYLDLEGAKLNTADMDQNAISSGVIDGKRVAVPLGDNAWGLIYDQEVVEGLGFKVPEPGYSWDDFAKLSNDIARKKSGYFGTSDVSGNMSAFQIWARQAGKELYGDDGKVAFGKTEATSWFEFWDSMRADGGAPPVDQTAEESGGFGNTMLVKGRCANYGIFVNVLNSFQALTKSRLSVTSLAMGDPSQSGAYIRASNWATVWSKTENPDLSVGLVDFMFNDPEGAAVLGAEFGAPPNLKIRETVTYDETAQIFIDYVNNIKDNFAQPLPSLAVEFPAGASDVNTAWTNASQLIGQKAKPITDAVDEFFAKAEAAV